MVSTAGAKAGDMVLLVGSFPLEGTAILAREFGSMLGDRGLLKNDLAQAARWLDQPGISITSAVRVLTTACRPHAMHDVTEGGVSGALHELAAASGVKIVLEQLPSPHPVAARICRALSADPLGLISSGSLLISVEPADAQRALAPLTAAGISADVIGRVEEGAGVFVTTPGGVAPFPSFERDELARLQETQRRGIGS
jgi:hydrogenase maturation factor